MRSPLAAVEKSAMFRCRILWLASLVLCLATSAFAQTTSSLRGKAVDAQGAILPGVLLQLVSAQTSFARNVVSDETGAYQFPQVPPGVYELAFGTRPNIRGSRNTISVLSSSARTRRACGS